MLENTRPVVGLNSMLMQKVEGTSSPNHMTLNHNTHQEDGGTKGVETSPTLGWFKYSHREMNRCLETT